jgi:hypothetical protein
MLNTHVITCEMNFVWILIILDENGCGLTILPLGYFKSWTTVWCKNHVVNGMFDFNVVDHKFFGEVCPTSQYLCLWLCGQNEDLRRCSHKLFVDHVMVFNDDLSQGFHRFHQPWKWVINSNIGIDDLEFEFNDQHLWMNMEIRDCSPMIHETYFITLWTTSFNCC